MTLTKSHDGIGYERPQSEYDADVLRSAEENHLWLNAFRCIRPSDAFAAEVGHAIIHMLKQPENLIEPRIALIESERVLVLRINQS